MTRIQEIKMALERLRREIGSEPIDHFLSAIDLDDLPLCTPDEICDQIRMAARLAPQNRVAVKVVDRGERRFDITIVAFDYFSEFSILCGLLASFGLDIQSGNVRTLDERPSRGKIIDLFQTRWRGKGTFDAEERKRFEEELRTLIGLLEEGLYAEARDRVNRRLVQFRPDREGAPSSLFSPIHVRFGHRPSTPWTLLDIRGKDAPGFLYAFSNALAMQGIYIHKVKIQSVGSEVRDRFYISDRRGGKIKSEKARKALKVSAVLTRQFTHFLNRAPDPAKAIAAFDQLLDKIMEKGAPRPFISFLKKEETLTILARLFGSSEFLWEDFLRVQFESLLPILDRFKSDRPPPDKPAMARALRRLLRGAASLDERKRTVNQYKDREIFRIDIAHLLSRGAAPGKTLTEFSNALTDLAEVVVEQAYRICDDHLSKRSGLSLSENGAVAPFSICALGKFGGRELGYASDIELLFVYGRTERTENDDRTYFEKLSQSIIQFIETKQEGIFHIDTRLRPYGNSGLLANALERFMAYYAPGGEAAPFERQALIKLRSVCGDKSLGREIEAYRDGFVYSGAPWDLKTALELRERQRRELVPAEKINVKYSAGGLLDIEYAAQYLQILHGDRHPELRTPNTLQALDQLTRLRILTRPMGKALREGYLFLRTLIDALRIVRGHAKDLLLPNPASEEFIFLARRMGYGQRDWEKGRTRLADEIARHMTHAREAFGALFTAD